MLAAEMAELVCQNGGARAEPHRQGPGTAAHSDEVVHPFRAVGASSVVGSAWTLLV